MKRISIAICRYPFALNSAIYGLEEMFVLANRICKEQEIAVAFEPHILASQVLEPDIQQANGHQSESKSSAANSQTSTREFHVIIIPPSSHNEYYLNPQSPLIHWLKTQHEQGSIIATACAGAFILAATGMINSRAVTTHWALADLFQQRYPQLSLDTDQILIDHGDIVTAGGMMSWLDLGLTLIERFASPMVMHQLGKALVVDTAPREQRFYRQFHPSFSHGDKAIVAIQHAINLSYAQPLSIHQLALSANLTERTMQRRFHKATGLNPNHYLQRVRIQKACDLLESTQHAFEWIASQVGYEDVSACRKVFVKIMGLTPKAFRQRFIGA